MLPWRLQSQLPLVWQALIQERVLAMARVPVCPWYRKLYQPWLREPVLSMSLQPKSIPAKAQRHLGRQ